jgi:hypothetical protein
MRTNRIDAVSSCIADDDLMMVGPRRTSRAWLFSGISRTWLGRSETGRKPLLTPVPTVNTPHPPQHRPRSRSLPVVREERARHDEAVPQVQGQVALVVRHQALRRDW